MRSLLTFRWRRMLYDHIIASNILVIYRFLVLRKFPVHLCTWQRQVHSGIVLLDAWCTFVNTRNVWTNDRRWLLKETVDSALPVNIFYSADRVYAIINSSLVSWGSCTQRQQYAAKRRQFSSMPTIQMFRCFMIRILNDWISHINLRILNSCITRPPGG